MTATTQRRRRLDAVPEAVIIAALTEAGAVLSDGARLLAAQGIIVSRSSLSRFVSDSDSLTNALSQIEAGKLDYCDKLLWTQIEGGDGHALRFFLGSKGKARGYGRTNVEVTTAPPVEEPIINPALLSQPELRLLCSLTHRAMGRKDCNDDEFVRAGILPPHPIDAAKAA